MRRFRVSPTMVVALVAVVLSVTGSAVAARLVTGKQIKDGSVGSKDLTKGLQKLLKQGGRTGPAGPQGAQGVSGQPGPATGAAGGDLAGSYPSPTIAPGAIGPLQLARTPAAKAIRAVTNQTVANDSNPELLCTTEQFDTQDLHDPVTNPGQMKAPIDGLYQVSAGVRWQGPNALGDRSLLISKEPSGSVLAGSQVPAAHTSATSLVASAIVQLEAGGRVGIRVSQSSGGPLDVVTSEGSFCAMRWIGPL